VYGNSYRDGVIQKCTGCFSPSAYRQWNLAPTKPSSC